MNTRGEVLLITGPAGSGKSTLAQYVAEKMAWEYISEDDYWVKNDWGHGLRTDEQEKIVQQQVFNDLVSIVSMGKSAVLEFILYKTPPSPLTAYQDILQDNFIPFNVIALKPSVEEIMNRLITRGRPNDLENIEANRKNAEHQLECLQPEYVNPDWVIDSTNLSVADLYALRVGF